MAENTTAAFRVTCYSASGAAQHKDTFDTEDAAKTWAQQHLKGFDRLVVEKKRLDQQGWEPTATFSHR